MKSENSRQQWLKEYREFLGTNDVPPPVHVTESIQGFVKRDLHPSFASIFTKLALVYVPVGSLSLLICAQFGVGRGHALSDIFMSYGHLTCMTICGALFLGMPMFAALLFLSPSEKKAIRQKAYLPILTVGLVSLFVFFCLGAEISTLVAMAWLGGGFVSGILATEIGIGLPRLAPGRR
jgi:hypothetical protein